MTSDPSQGASERDQYVLEEGEVPDIIVEEPKEEEHGWTSGLHVDQLEEILVRGKDPTKTVKVGGGLDPEIKKDLVELLREYNDIFTWSHEEMPGIPLSLATHRLAVDETSHQ